MSTSASHPPVPPRSAAAALEFVRNGGRLVIPTHLTTTVIDARVLARFERASARLLWEDGDGYRIARGRRSDYILPGQLRYVNEAAV